MKITPADGMSQHAEFTQPFTDKFALPSCGGGTGVSFVELIRGAWRKCSHKKLKAEKMFARSLGVRRHTEEYAVDTLKEDPNAFAEMS